MYVISHVPTPNETEAEYLIAFPAKLDGTSGHIILEPRNDVLADPQIAFVPISGREETFVHPIDNIVEIQKVIGRLFTLSSTPSQGEDEYMS